MRWINLERNISSWQSTCGSYGENTILIQLLTYFRAYKNREAPKGGIVTVQIKSRLPVVMLLVWTFAGSACAQVCEIALLQLNDVYEMRPVRNGTLGGLARVATVRKELVAQNANTFTILAGDFLSPSALGTARVDGERLAGRQMVDVLNRLGLDYVTFGNHEFDLKEERFHKRLAESHFTWVSSNVVSASEKAFSNVPEHVVFTLQSDTNEPVRVGLFGITLIDNQPDYAQIKDPLKMANEQVHKLRDQVDILIAITHLNLEQDIQLAETVPGIDLIVGGHEHENVQMWRGSNMTPIFKADSNARSVYIHRLHYNTRTRNLQIESHLKQITDAIPSDPALEKQIDSWVEQAYEGFRDAGFNPENLVTTLSEPLDGRDATIIRGPTNLTDLIANSVIHAAPESQVAIFNSGTIRIDDTVPPGPITEYDVIRVIPFGDRVFSLEVKGRLLQRILEQGRNNRGSGAFLQTANIRFQEGSWLVGEKRLEVDQVYRVAVNEFLLTGKEKGLDFLTKDNPDLRVIQAHADIRTALIAQLKRVFDGH